MQIVFVLLLMLSFFIILVLESFCANFISSSYGLGLPKQFREKQKINIDKALNIKIKDAPLKQIGFSTSYTVIILKNIAER